jgi:hypothetical protein
LITQVNDANMLAGLLRDASYGTHTRTEDAVSAK